MNEIVINKSDDYKIEVNEVMQIDILLLDKKGRFSTSIK